MFQYIDIFREEENIITKCPRRRDGTIFRIERELVKTKGGVEGHKIMLYLGILCLSVAIFFLSFCQNSNFENFIVDCIRGPVFFIAL
jgi:hypothetical protein